MWLVRTGDVLAVRGGVVEASARVALRESATCGTFAASVPALGGSAGERLDLVEEVEPGDRLVHAGHGLETPLDPGEEVERRRVVRAVGPPGVDLDHDRVLPSDRPVHEVHRAGHRRLGAVVAVIVGLHLHAEDEEAAEERAPRRRGSRRGSGRWRGSA
jgi:hypothetical protein